MAGTVSRGNRLLTFDRFLLQRSKRCSILLDVGANRPNRYDIHRRLLRQHVGSLLVADQGCSRVRYSAELRFRVEEELEASDVDSFSAMLPPRVLETIEMMVLQMDFSTAVREEQIEIVSRRWLGSKMRFDDIVEASQVAKLQAFQPLESGVPVAPRPTDTFLLFLVNGSICFVNRGIGFAENRRVLLYPLAGYRPGAPRELVTRYGKLVGNVELGEVVDVRRDLADQTIPYVNEMVTAGAVAGRANDEIETNRYRAVDIED